MSLSSVVFSSKSDDWATPEALYRELDAEFDFDDDPCPIGQPAPLFGTPDGLSRKWGNRVFCNPPYSNVVAFLEKATREHPAVCVFLVPARTDTAWFHDYILGRAEIRFIRGRLKFGNAKTGAPFPSLIAIFREEYPFSCDHGCDRWCGGNPCLREGK